MLDRYDPRGSDNRDRSSIVRSLLLMPTAARYPPIASPIEEYGGHGYRSPASNPLG